MDFVGPTLYKLGCNILYLDPSLNEVRGTLLITRMCYND